MGSPEELRSPDTALTATGLLLEEPRDLEQEILGQLAKLLAPSARPIRETAGLEVSML